MKPTEEQQEIINAVKSGNNLHVAAFAGTGKMCPLKRVQSKSFPCAKKEKEQV
ncbi:hypothetical protein PsalN5692_03584 (plasmid) [Piscirickettsia salmonis]|uniref:hypothetical protein n=1 Tax=Piscirickettsia salmonis TaxID=1238 RepID=UPI0012B98A6F|nr:hypothetical protein [Piscirickettsia salmonis]QGP52076.1 hypothetical protein PsalN5692_03584 [Piscirickettsia salmonis]